MRLLKTHPGSAPAADQNPSAMRRRVLLAGSSVAVQSLAAPAFAATGDSTARDIVIGQTAVLTGPTASTMLAFNAGAQLAFSAANDAGGIAGRKIRVLSLDDGLDPVRAAKNYASLASEHNVLACYGASGSPTTAAGLALLKQTNTPLIGSLGLSDSVRERAAGIAYFPVAGYGREAARILEQLATLGMERVAVAYLDNPGGQEFRDLAAKSVKALSSNLTLVAQGAVRIGGANVAEVAGQIADSRPQATILFLVGAPAVELVRRLWEKGNRATYFGTSILDSAVVAKSLGPSFRGMTSSQVVPHPWSQSDSVAREFRSRSSERNLSVTYPTYAGYITGLFIVEALRRCSTDLTRAGLHRAIRAYRGRLAGLDLDFTSGSATGGRYVDLVYAKPDGSYVR